MEGKVEKTIEPDSSVSDKNPLPTENSSEAIKDLRKSVAIRQGLQELIQSTGIDVRFIDGIALTDRDGIAQVVLTIHFPFEPAS